MSTVSDAIVSLAPYHLLAYGTLLGTELYQVCGICIKTFKPISCRCRIIQ